MAERMEKELARSHGLSSKAASGMGTSCCRRMVRSPSALTEATCVAGTRNISK